MKLFLDARHHKIPLLYFVLSSIYIVSSSGLLYYSTPGYSFTAVWTESAKGLGFVAVTAVLLWIALYREARARTLRETSFKALFEAIDQAVFVVRMPERVIRYANPAACATFGYTERDLIGESTAKLHVDRQHFLDFNKLCEAAVAADGTCEGEFEMRRSNGEIFPTENSVSVVVGMAGGEGHVVSIVRDVSVRRAMDRQLRESEARFREIAENLREVFWVSDPDKSQFEYVSPAYEAIWGQSVRDLYENPSAFLDAVHPDDVERVKRIVARERVQGVDFHYRIVRPDGEIRWIWSRATPVADEAGNVYRIVGVAEDITEIKDAESRLQQAEKMEALGQLVGGIAHDFNNLLTVVLGNLHMLRSRLHSPDDLKLLDRVIDAAGQEGRMVEQLLLFSRRRDLVRERTDVNDLLRRMDDLMRLTLGETVAVEVRYCQQPCLADVDAGHLQAALINLAVNARDAMPDGGRLTVETDVVELGPDDVLPNSEAAPGRYIAIAVTDTGHGISASNLTRVFEPFFTTKDPGRGTGLGLAMVYGFVRQSGGHVRVDSEPGCGTSFTLYLPASGKPEAAVPQDKQTAAGALAHGSEVILLVEDRDVVRETTATLLENLGYRVLQAADGPEALGVLADHPEVQLLFSDTIMPGGVTGPELARRARALYPELRVLLTSGYPGKDSLGIEGHDWLRKPFSAAGLASAIRRTLDAGR